MIFPSIIFFDMDGVLIHSEPFWKEAEREVFLREFGHYISDEALDKSMGLKTTEVVILHAAKYQLSSEEVLRIGVEIEKAVVARIKEAGKAMPGLYELVDWIKKTNLRRMLVTSSSEFVLENVVEYLGLETFFERKFSAYNHPKGKPDPAVYLEAIHYSELDIDKILVIEDSKNGVRAAKSAKLNVWALPDRNHYKDLSFFYQNASFVAKTHFDILDKLQTIYQEL